jgi:hypothetical protein
MNAGFVHEYEGCNITTTAVFVGTGLGGYGLPTSDLGDNAAAFRAIAPGEKMPSGAQIANFATLPKEQSDMIFSLKPGDSIRLTGGTHVLPYYGALAFFVATSISRSK